MTGACCGARTATPRWARARTARPAEAPQRAPWPVPVALAVGLALTACSPQPAHAISYAERLAAQERRREEALSATRAEAEQAAPGGAAASTSAESYLDKLKSQLSLKVETPAGGRGGAESQPMSAPNSDAAPAFKPFAFLNDGAKGEADVGATEKKAAPDVVKKQGAASSKQLQPEPSMKQAQPEAKPFAAFQERRSEQQQQQQEAPKKSSIVEAPSQGGGGSSADDASSKPWWDRMDELVPSQDLMQDSFKSAAQAPATPSTPAPTPPPAVKPPAPQPAAPKPALAKANAKAKAAAEKQQPGKRKPVNGFKLFASELALLGIYAALAYVTFFRSELFDGVKEAVDKQLLRVGSKSE